MTTKPADILATIIASKKQEVQQLYQLKTLEQWREEANNQPATRDFLKAITVNLQQNKVAVIAEIKKASPSQGIIRANFDVGAIASSYQQHGAVCLSVLTDVEYFHGHSENINLAKEASTLPVLRKDFIIDPLQIYQSRLIGADAILLIVAALTLSQLIEFQQIAAELGMAVLVECHDQDELELALQVATPLIGINNRNLRTFAVDLHTSLRLKAKLSSEHILISESGIQQKSDIQLLKNSGIYSYLIGESFMRAEDPGMALAELIA